MTFSYIIRGQSSTADDYRMSFGGNGIFVGGKDTFVSELTGTFSVTGELAASSVTGASGPVARITVLLGSERAAQPPAITKCGLLDA